MKKLLLGWVMIVAITFSAMPVEIDRTPIWMVEPVFKADEQLIKSANEGQASAQYTLGMYYYDRGKGLETNLVETTKWFRNAAEQGHAEAQVMYGECMDLAGNGKEAVKWYLKAAEQGALGFREQEKLAKMYAEGRGVEKNWIEAVKWYRKAVEDIEKKCEEWRQGSKERILLPWCPCEPACAIGDIYAKGGWGVEKDETEAFIWYHKAAENGNSDAMLTLAEMYFCGIGVDKNAAEAVKWYHKASERDNEKAYYKLADCYMHGNGVYKDVIEATKWWLKWLQKCHPNFLMAVTLLGCFVVGLLVFVIVKKIL